MSLEETIKEIQKQFGKESIIKMDQEGQKLEVIPTGSLLLDKALGIGGYPRGRMIELYGQPASGKTTCALHAIAEVQKLGGKCAFFDMEHCLALDYAANIGVNVKEMWLSQPDCGEQAFDIIEALVRSNDIDLIVVDSVAALTPRAEIEGASGESHMGLQARLMSQACKKLSGIVAKTNSTIIFINQIRQNIGIMFGNPETTPGGNALKFYTSIRLEIRKMSKMKKGEDTFGNEIKIKVVKNKLAPPFKEVVTSIIFGKGIDLTSEKIQDYIDRGIITKSGAWLKYKDKSFQDKKELINFIEKSL